MMATKCFESGSLILDTWLNGFIIFIPFCTILIVNTDKLNFTQALFFYTIVSLLLTSVNKLLATA